MSNACCLVADDHKSQTGKITIHRKRLKSIPESLVGLEEWELPLEGALELELAVRLQVLQVIQVLQECRSPRPGQTI